MTATCSNGDGRNVLAKGLCNSCYQSRRLTEKRAEARSQERVCSHCGETFSGRRPNALYCSSRCKDAAHAAPRRAAAAERLQGRSCRLCKGPINSVSPKAQCCSRECSVAWRNQKRAAERQAALAGRRCHCGKELTGRGGQLYCSPQCKSVVHSARWRAKAPDYMRRYKYGLTPGEFAALLEAQKGKCAICRTSEWQGRGRVPHVDHDHETGSVRGILCTNCNQGLGRFGDDPARLRAAAAYLER